MQSTKSNLATRLRCGRNNCLSSVEAQVDYTPWSRADEEDAALHATLHAALHATLHATLEQFKLQRSACGNRKMVTQLYR